MATEIERKFLVGGPGWKSGVRSKHSIRQGYLVSTERITVRVRIIDEKAATLTVKTAQATGVRNEYEYEIPVRDAGEIIRNCTGAIICKERHLIPSGSYTWEVDEFLGEHSGLVIAEIELPAVDTLFEKPDWIGAEVTADPRFYNSTLARRRAA